jgi:hypothetical protein
MIRKIGIILGRSESDLRSNLDLQKMSPDKRKRIESIDEPYKIKILKIQILEEEMVFLDKKIIEFRSKTRDLSAR